MGKKKIDPDNVRSVQGVPRCPLCGLHLDYTVKLVEPDSAEFQLTKRSVKHVTAAHINLVKDVLS